MKLDRRQTAVIATAPSFDHNCARAKTLVSLYKSECVENMTAIERTGRPGDDELSTQENRSPIDDSNGAEEV